ncbi:MAG: 3-hydroxyacyl-CoA dehydrogenase NAD-binding domain-containing protein, partial [Desulfofustis sp.]|nr:3-hydroxyacyl-CoA dehydrogenase NAD-binding domain-containing protein [Desulfofustis sp.]
MEIRSFGVVGAGQMGSGIAQVAAASGLDVVMSDISDDCTARGLQSIEKNLQRSVDKGKLDQDTCRAIRDRISTTTRLADLAGVDFVVEAAVEMEELKFGIFRELDTVCPDHVILATNTSSIPIGRIGAQTKRPEKVIGMHFMNPVPVMKLVEVIPG